MSIFPEKSNPVSFPSLVTKAALPAKNEAPGTAPLKLHVELTNVSVVLTVDQISVS